MSSFSGLRELRWFKFPTGAGLVAVALVAIGEATVWGAFGVFMVVFTMWLAWSIVSGIYPWSMRL